MLKNRQRYLFDLDGTLLTINIDKFLNRYFAALSAEFDDLYPDKQGFISNLMASTQKMIKNDGKKTNREVFMEDFLAHLNGEDREEIKKRFHDFYQNVFPSLEKDFEIDKQTPANIISYLKEKNKSLVLATNPLFPRQAVVERLNWAGIAAEDFDFISSYENMSYAKPNPNYYQEILDKIGASPNNCLMIGNDLEDDTAAQDIGIPTLIINNHLIENEAKDLDLVWQGSLDEFYSLIKSQL
ncbi:HAD family hydrolase [Halanaerobium hydrogeniformans]|uniref:HAD-superfamily hydrolase, subfamily IA, variant 1 n=1 Tax=Halanaerobium hydrogeniformans TaxID=656519 RepID=E4RK09_HALHG|nr:HAD family hydrolase [Halanaerobium hydrogeniformans]ADQ15579.1 HAD-superfamily hydrolase, subfamily IA, variant 1 [Halanaerobium hydrogeniformans]